MLELRYWELLANFKQQGLEYVMKIFDGDNPDDIQVIRETRGHAQGDLLHEHKTQQ